MIVTLIFLPVFGFLCGALFGHLFGIGTCFITFTFILFSFVLSFLLLCYIIFTGSIIKVMLGSWVYADSLCIEWSFMFDSLTVIMLVVVTFISTLVHLYSIEYMKEDPHINRFMSYLSLFTFFMLILVTASNLLQMFVGWEGVGLSSYLLINFWFTRIQANKSAIKAMLVNRIGDFFILLSIFLINFIFNSLDYDIILHLADNAVNYYINTFLFQVPLIDIICLFLFFGAMGKSAQIGLHVWLPDAMEGPTPVSALIHAATMVTAGIFLIIRFSFLFELSSFVLNLVVLVGSLTVLFAATTGLFQNDIKKIIAYSTCSQLGYMTFACGLSGYEVGVFHLFNHAFFKALLFLGAGSVIHAFSDEQDMRKMGGLKSILPFSYASIVIGSMALTGFPFLSGFYSKDVILEVAFSKFTIAGHFSGLLGTITAFITAFYSTRLILLVFLVNPNGNKVSVLNVHEGSWKISTPLFILSILSLFIGFFAKDIFIGFGSSFWVSSIFVDPSNYLLLDIEFISLAYKLAPLIFTILGAVMAIHLYVSAIGDFFEVKRTKLFKIVYTFFNRKWYMDRLNNQFITQFFLFLGYYNSYRDIDRGVLELLGPYVVESLLDIFFIPLKGSQSGNIFQYLFFFIASAFFIIFFSLIII